MRPRLDLQKEPVDKALEIAGIIGVMTMIALPVYYWPEMPQIVPTHFTATGRPDAYGSKWVTLVLPVIGTALFVLLIWLNRFPHKFNYPKEITEENAACAIPNGHPPDQGPWYARSCFIRISHIHGYSYKHRHYAWARKVLCTFIRPGDADHAGNSYLLITARSS